MIANNAANNAADTAAGEANPSVAAGRRVGLPSPFAFYGLEGRVMEWNERQARMPGNGWQVEEMTGQTPEMNRYRQKTSPSHAACDHAIRGSHCRHQPESCQGASRLRNAAWNAAIAGIVLLSAASLRGDEPEPSRSYWTLDKIPNFASSTLGGKQFWTDELVRGEWRMQKNVLTGHYRLLDPEGVRRGWGTWEQCKQAWDELDAADELPVLKKKVVLVLHGLVRSRDSMSGMAQYLAADHDYSVLNLSYASTRVPLADHAAALQRVVSRLDGVEEINFVAHSMGNLVVRHFLGDQLIAARGLGIDPRIRRIVMLAPPNGGANLAKRFQNNVVFQVVFGTSGQQLGKQWDDLETRLAVPPCEFGIVAGGSEDGEGRNPLLDGDDDLVVSVEETRLAGARDFVVLPAVHTLIMDHPQAREYTKRFLDEGYFISEAQRQPILAGTADSGDAR